MTPKSARTDLASQRGAALIVALVMLLVMTVLGVTAARNTNLEERMAGNLRDSNLAFQAAEAALREAETFLRSNALPPFTGVNGLLPIQTDAGKPSFWNTYNWSGNGITATGITGVYGAPRYVIEELPAVPPAGGSERFAALPESGFYRVTARGQGGTANAIVILQSTYRR